MLPRPSKKECFCRLEQEVNGFVRVWTNGWPFQTVCKRALILCRTQWNQRISLFSIWIPVLEASLRATWMILSQPIAGNNLWNQCTRWQTNNSWLQHGPWMKIQVSISDISGDLKQTRYVSLGGGCFIWNHFMINHSGEFFRLQWHAATTFKLTNHGSWSFPWYISCTFV